MIVPPHLHEMLLGAADLHAHPMHVEVRLALEAHVHRVLLGQLRRRSAVLLEREGSLEALEARTVEVADELDAIESVLYRIPTDSERRRLAADWN